LQLLFTRDETVLLATLLEDCERQLRGPAVGSDQAEANRRRRHNCVVALLDAITSSHPKFDADQLDDLAEALRHCKQRATEQLAATADEPSRRALEQRLKHLEQILDKVTEACAMA
jgi:uncharacterized membrane protein YccC